MTLPALKIVLFVHIVDQVGGAEGATKRLALQLSKRGHDVTILSTQPLRQFRQRREMITYSDGIRTIRLPVWQRSARIFSNMLILQAHFVFATLLRNSQILQMRKIDWNTVRLARIARRTGTKTICVPQASGTRGDLATFPCRAAHESLPYDWISALTSDIRREVTAWGYPASHIGIIPNGVDTEYFCPPEVPPFLQSALFVGQFRPEKHLDVLLRAWREVNRVHPRARLTLLGGGQYLTEYKQMATDLRISPDFIPNSSIDAVRSILQRHAVFVLPGTSEGMSNALLEAMAVGLAPVTSDFPGNRVLVIPERNGLCYDSNAPELLAEHLCRLFADPELVKRMGAAARSTVAAAYGLHQIADQYDMLYRQVLVGSKL